MGPGGCTDQMLASQTEFKGVAVGSHILLRIGTFGLPLDQGRSSQSRGRSECGDKERVHKTHVESVYVLELELGKS